MLAIRTGKEVKRGLPLHLDRNLSKGVDELIEIVFNRLYEEARKKEEERQASLLEAIIKIPETRH